MKKSKISLLALLLASIMVFLCSCGESLDKRSESIVGDQLTGEEYSVLRNPENYRYAKNSPKEFVYTDQPILRCFPYLELPQYVQSPADFKDDTSLGRMYIVFDEKPIVITKSLNDESSDSPVTLDIYYADTSLPYIQDLLHVKPIMKILGKRCVVQDVLLTTALAPFTTIIMYYDTDQGCFVRYYHETRSSEWWFTLEEFMDYAQQYNDALTENARQMMNEPLVGFPTFYDFLKSAQSQTTEK